MVREDAAVLGLDCPEASLVVHLRPRELAHPSNQIRVPAARPWRPLFSCCHGCSLLLLLLLPLLLLRNPRNEPNGNPNPSLLLFICKNC